MELDNLRAAVDWSLETPGEEELAFRIIAALAYEATDFRAAGIGAWAERAARVPALDSSPNRSWVLSVAAYGAFHRGDLGGTEGYVRAISRDATPAWVHATGALGNVVASRGDVPTALALYKDAMDAIGSGDEWAYPSCWVRSVRGIYASVLGDTELARAETEAGLRAARRFEQPSALALALYASAMAHVDTDPGYALKAAEESVGLLRSGASDVVYAGATLVLSMLRERAGRAPDAAAAVREAIAHSDEIGDRAWIQSPMNSALRLLAAQGEEEAAIVIAGALLEGWFRELVLTFESDVAQRGAILRAAEAALGPERYAAARARGAAMTYEEAVGYALGELDRVFPGR
jgi:hypothetical protein